MSCLAGAHIAPQLRQQKSSFGLDSARWTGRPLLMQSSFPLVEVTLEHCEHTSCNWTCFSWLFPSVSPGRAHDLLKASLSLWGYFGCFSSDCFCFLLGCHDLPIAHCTNATFSRGPMGHQAIDTPGSPSTTTPLGALPPSGFLSFKTSGSLALVHFSFAQTARASGVGALSDMAVLRMSRQHLTTPNVIAGAQQVKR